jgi:hypothetical protein
MTHLVRGGAPRKMDVFTETRPVAMGTRGIKIGSGSESGAGGSSPSKKLTFEAPLSASDSRLITRHRTDSSDQAKSPSKSSSSVTGSKTGCLLVQDSQTKAWKMRWVELNSISFSIFDNEKVSSISITFIIELCEASINFICLIFSTLGPTWCKVDQ